MVTQDQFDALLGWLDSDPERAAQRYEEIRRRLIKILVCRGCWEAEDLTDKAIDRVAGKVAEVAPTYQGDPILYFYGVLKKVYQEWLRKQATPLAVPAPAPDPPDDDDDLEYKCLEECMQRRTPEERTLVLEYYEGEGQSKIDHRKVLADRRGIGLNTLRIRVFRIRAALQECVEQLMKQFRNQK